MGDSLPLDGVRVVELGEGISAAFCARMLAGLGAEVWKIERPGQGDSARRTPDLDGQKSDPEANPLFLYLNTGKKSVTLNLQDQRGRDLLMALVGKANCVVENMRSRQWAALGMEPGRLRDKLPALVVTSITPFGQTGPYRDFEATNLIEFAMGGQMALTGEPSREPLVNGGSQAEYQGGLHALPGTLAALARATATGLGEHLDISIVECQASTLETANPATVSLDSTTSAQWKTRRGNIIAATWALYQVKDGYAGLYYLPRQYPKVFDLIGEPDLLQDDRFKDPQTALQANDELVAIISAYFLEHGKLELFERAASQKGCVGFVASMPEVLSSPQEVARDFFVRVTHPRAGTYTEPTAPWILNDGERDLQFRIAGPAPLLGQDTAAVLTAELGLSDSKLKELSQAGVI
jgi:crotonobetainyl-CoA:carnitine CoA-transferase CaiB-like acyl-CoA transferase